MNLKKDQEKKDLNKKLEFKADKKFGMV